MKRLRRAAPAQLLLPALALCLLGHDIGQAQDAKNAPRHGLRAPVVPVTILVDGRQVPVKVPGGTVGDALKAAGVEMDALDECSPALTDAVTPGMAITVHRVAVTTLKEIEAIPARSRVLPTRRLHRGMTMIQQHPQAGVREVTYRITSRDGEETKREVLKSETIRPAKDKIILVGGSEARLPSRGGYFSGRRVMTMVASGYDPSPHSCGYGNGGRTYLGWKARKGVVAVDPRVIPLGARLLVEGYGECIAGDIGSAIKGNRIDLCFPTAREADRYGLKKVKVVILSE